METFFLVLRVGVSLAVVLGLLFMVRRTVARRMTTGREQLVNVVARQGISPKAAVAVVDLDGRRYVLGTADAGVTLLDSYATPARFELSLLEARSDVEDACAAYEPEVAAGNDGTGGMPSSAADHGRHVAPQRARHGRAGASHAEDSALSGSILSPRTWAQAVSALRRGPSA